MAAKKIADKLISDHFVAMFSKSFCPYCSRAKELFSHLNLSGDKIKILDLDKTPEGSDIQDYLLEKTGQRTVPNIFIDGQHIGGYDDLVQYESRGDLAKAISSL
ncbi:hypothetical protein MSPP1_003786 [Malassezia sp. CBS 17886]|nr:hypothetical protein MSPP1_003786 [Malassezia sp. CBS 17886]